MVAAFVLAGLPWLMNGTRRDWPPEKVPTAEVSARLQTTELAVFGLT